MRTIIKIGLVLLFSLASQATWAKASDIDVKDFFKNPEFSALQLSPNGKYIAVLSPVNSRRNIVIMETNGLKNIRPITGFREQDIRAFYWANNQDIVFTLDSDGNEAFSIFTIDTNDKKSKVVKLVGSNVSTEGIRSAATVHRLMDDRIISLFNIMVVELSHQICINCHWAAVGAKNVRKTAK